MFLENLFKKKGEEKKAMYIIAGLGNPGRDYAGTRHNVGFEVIDAIAAKYGISVKKTRFNGIFGEGKIGGEKVILLKPQTFMNLSGECVRDFKAWYKIEETKIIIIYDDISLPVGKLRIRQKGSAGGHNGIKNIIYQLKTDVFPRIKVGIGQPENKDYDLADYVLGHFSGDEVKELTEAAIRAADAVEVIIKDGAEKAMSKFN